MNQRKYKLSSSSSSDRGGELASRGFKERWIQVHQSSERAKKKNATQKRWRQQYSAAISFFSEENLFVLCLRGERWIWRFNFGVALCEQVQLRARTSGLCMFERVCDCVLKLGEKDLFPFYAWRNGCVAAYSTACEIITYSADFLLVHLIIGLKFDLMEKLENRWDITKSSVNVKNIFLVGWNWIKLYYLKATRTQGFLQKQPFQNNNEQIFRFTITAALSMQ